MFWTKILILSWRGWKYYLPWLSWRSKSRILYNWCLINIGMWFERWVKTLTLFLSSFLRSKRLFYHLFLILMGSKILILKRTFFSWSQLLWIKVERWLKIKRKCLRLSQKFSIISITAGSDRLFILYSSSFTMEAKF